MYVAMYEFIVKLLIKADIVYRADIVYKYYPTSQQNKFPDLTMNSKVPVDPSNRIFIVQNLHCSKLIVQRAWI